METKKYNVVDVLGNEPLSNKPHKIIVGTSKLEYEFNVESKQYELIIDKSKYYWGYCEPIAEYCNLYGGIFDEVELIEV